MNYIVMDLEWNQGSHQDEIKKQIPFEIIEIGAVKLNEKRERVDQFHRVIKPAIYLELFPITQDLVPIAKEELEQGGTFLEVIRDFFVWCGSEYQFCTWGNMDLVELQRNMEFYGVNDILTKAFFYYDVQKIFSLQTEGKKNQKTLEYAVQYFDFNEKMEFHRAIFDAEYTAMIFQRLDMNLINRYFSIDYYNNPKGREDEIFVHYGNYTKLISKEYACKEDIFEDQFMKYIPCVDCGKLAERKIDWFSNNAKNYYALAKCKEHGFLKGRIQINKARNGKRFAVRIISHVTKEGAKTLKNYHDEIVIKKSEN